MVPKVVGVISRSLKWRSHMVENVGFGTEFGEPRLKNVGLDMCLTLRS